MRNNTPIVIGLIVLGILGIGLTAFMFLGPKLAGGPAPVAEAPPAKVQAWVAGETIPPRTTIKGTMLEQRDLTAEEAKDAITDRDKIIGRLVSQPIEAGQIISETKLAKELTRVVPANFAIPAGMRAVAVYVNSDRTVAGLVDVGDRVDVIVTHELKVSNTIGGENLNTVAGRTIAQNLEVLAVDRSIEKAAAPVVAPPPEPAPGAAPAANAPPPPPPNAEDLKPAVVEPNYRVVMAAPPAIAERIAAANRSGQINLTIRNPDSNDVLPDPQQALEYPVKLVSSSPATSPAASLEERKAAQARADKLRQEKRSDRLAAQERADARSMQRAEFENQIKLARINKVPPAPPSVFPTVEIDNRPSDAANLPTPPMPPQKEVLVVRGTEKTRVLVPSN